MKRTGSVVSHGRAQKYERKKSIVSDGLQAELEFTVQSSLRKRGSKEMERIPLSIIFESCDEEYFIHTMIRRYVSMQTYIIKDFKHHHVPIR